MEPTTSRAENGPFPCLLQNTPWWNDNETGLKRRLEGGLGTSHTDAWSPCTVLYRYYVKRSLWPWIERVYGQLWRRFNDNDGNGQLTMIDTVLNECRCVTFRYWVNRHCLSFPVNLNLNYSYYDYQSSVISIINTIKHPYAMYDNNSLLNSLLSIPVNSRNKVLIL